MSRILVIGGGLGGLTAATALGHEGFDAQVFEAAPELQAVGAGIWAPPNALQVLDRIGLARRVLEAGVPLVGVEVRDVSGTILQRLDGFELQARFGHRIVSLRRSALQEILAGALGPERLHLGRRLVAIETDRDGVTARFEDGSEARGELLVAADGLRSTARARLFPEARLRYSGQTCFRGLAAQSLPEGLEATAWEVWGGRHRFGFSPVGGGRVYWFAPLTAPEATVFDAPLAELRRRYARFPEPVPALLAATADAELLQTDLFDLEPLPSWQAGRVLLIGDAAHAATPNLGQGGAQALEDAVFLADHLAEGGATPEALAGFVAARRARAQKVVTLSRSYGVMAHLESCTLRRARNATLRLASGALGANRLDDLFLARG